MDVKLYIENQLCDLPSGKDFNIKLNRQFLDLQKIDSRSGDFSYSLRLPKTANNNVIFKSVNVVNTVGKFVRTDDFLTKLVTKGNNTFQGIFKLTKITDEFYEGVLISNNISWIKLLEGKNINELTELNNQPWGFPFKGAGPEISANTTSWWIANANYNQHDICFPLVPRDYFYHSGETINVNGIYNDSLNTADIPPAVYRNKIVQKIFDSINWNVDSDIFSDTEQCKVVIPFTNGNTYKYNYKYLYEAEASASTISASYYNDLALTTLPGTSTFDKDFTYGGFITYTTAYYQYPFSIKYLFPDVIISNPNNPINVFGFNNVPGTPTTANQYLCGVDGGLINIDFDCTFKSGSGNTYHKLPWTAFNRQGNTAATQHVKIRGGIVAYLYTDDETEIEILNDISENYIWSEDDSATIENTNVIFYYDVYQSLEFNSPVSYQPYDQDADISVTTSADYGHIDFINPSTPIDPTHFVEEREFHITGGTINIEIRNINLPETQQVRFAWIDFNSHAVPAFPAFGFVLQPAINDVELENVNVHFYADPATNIYNDVIIGENLPQMSCTEFLKDFISTTNSFVSFDEVTKTIRFDSFDNFFLGNESAYDITDKCDLENGEPEISPMNISRNIYFKYKTDNSDVLLNKDIEYGNLQITSDNVYTSGDQTVTSLFAPVRLKSWDLSGITSNVISLPTILSTDSEIIVQSAITWGFSTSPRILKTDGYFITSGETQYINVAGYPSQILLSRFEDDREGKLSLRWDDDNGLYETYYSRYLNDIGDSHVVQYLTRINNLDYINMLPNVPVRVNGQHYILEKIDGFSPIFDSFTQVRLIKKSTS